MTFSERHGFEEQKVLQVNDMDTDLKNSIWNVFYRNIFQREKLTRSGYTLTTATVTTNLWTEYFKKRVNDKPTYNGEFVSVMQDYYDRMKWNKVYDLVEFVYQYFVSKECFVRMGGRQFPLAFVFNTELNETLEREKAGYRLVKGEITPITDPIEMEEVAEAMRPSPFSKASQRMREAVRALSDRENPDYRQAMETAWFAVDSCIKEITGVEQGGFAKIMNKLESENEAQHHFCESIKNLYSFANKAGIRHAKGDVEPKNLTAKQLALINFDNAKFFVVFCSAFMNYLKTRLPLEK